MSPSLGRILCPTAKAASPSRSNTASTSATSSRLSPGISGPDARSRSRNRSPTVSRTLPGAPLPAGFAGSGGFDLSGHLPISRGASSLSLRPLQRQGGDFDPQKVLPTHRLPLRAIPRCLSRDTSRGFQIRNILLRTIDPNFVDHTSRPHWQFQSSRSLLQDRQVGNLWFTIVAIDSASSFPHPQPSTPLAILQLDSHFAILKIAFHDFLRFNLK